MVTEAPEVATSKSMTAVVPSALKRRAQPAVPVATAVPEVTALAVRTPPVAVPNGEPQVSVTSRVPVAAVSGVAG